MTDEDLQVWRREREDGRKRAQEAERKGIRAALLAEKLAKEKEERRKGWRKVNCKCGHAAMVKAPVTVRTLRLRCKRCNTVQVMNFR